MSATSDRRPKVTIVGGGGGVGASAAARLLLGTVDADVVLVDRLPAMVTSHEMDLEQLLGLGATGAVRAGDADDVADADVVVLSASVPLRLNGSRLDFLADNWAVVRETAEALGARGADWAGVLLVVTNPVDPLVLAALRHAGLARGRVLGYSLNDSLRLRSGIAAQLGVVPADVEAWVVGEHGDASTCLWDRVRVAGAPVALDDAQRAAAEDFLRGWYARHVALDSGRTSTWTSGAGVAAMAEAVLTDANTVWPATVGLDGERGLHDTALSLPIRLGAGGLRAFEPWELAPADEAALVRAGDVVRAAADTLRGAT